MTVYCETITPQANQYQSTTANAKGTVSVQYPRSPKVARTVSTATLKKRRKNMTTRLIWISRLKISTWTGRMIMLMRSIDMSQSPGDKYSREILYFKTLIKDESSRSTKQLLNTSQLRPNQDPFPSLINMNRWKAPFNNKKSISKHTSVTMNLNTIQLQNPNKRKLHLDQPSKPIPSLKSL